MDTGKIDRIAVVIIVFLIVISYFAFIKSGWAKLAGLKEQEALLTEHVSSSGDIASELERIGGEIQRIHENLEEFDRQLPEDKRIYDLLAEIDSLANNNNVKLEGITPGTLEKEALYARVPVTVSAKAAFRDFYTFLFQLENIPRITRTDGLKITRLPEGNRCRIEMDLAVFVGSE